MAPRSAGPRTRWFEAASSRPGLGEREGLSRLVLRSPQLTSGANIATCASLRTRLRTSLRRIPSTGAGYAALDLETTGHRPGPRQSDRVGAVAFTTIGSRRRWSAGHPGAPCPKRLLKLTGSSPRSCVGRPAPSPPCESWRTSFGAATRSAHGARLDVDFLAPPACGTGHGDPRHAGRGADPSCRRRRVTASASWRPRWGSKPAAAHRASMTRTPHASCCSGCTTRPRP